MSCVIGPGENPLRPGEIAIRINACLECGKSPSKDVGELFFWPIVGIDAWSPEEGDFIKWGVLCKKHTSMGTHVWGE